MSWYLRTTGQRILTKGHHRTSCRYWGLNDPFAAYTAAETPDAFQCRSTSRTTLSRGESWLHLINGSFGPPKSAPEPHPARFRRFCGELPCDRHTDDATCDICSNRPHLMHCDAAWKIALERTPSWRERIHLLIAAPRVMNYKWIIYHCHRVGDHSWRCRTVT